MMHEKKKLNFLPLISIMVCILFLTACEKEPVSYDYDFVNITWTRDAENDTEFIRFSDDGSFSYYCACGNPVNDSDLCEGYTYNPDTMMIKLDYFEKTSETISEIKLVECTEDTLTLDFDGDIRTFIPEQEEGEYITSETVDYEGNTYVYMGFNEDIFYYDLSSSMYYEEDIVHLISNEKRDMVYLNGDLFVLDAQVEDARAYYGDDANYQWSVEIYSDDSEEPDIYPLTISAEDLIYIYGYEAAEKKETLFFEQIEEFGMLKKTSEDGLISGSTSLAFYEGAWYWRSEMIDESAEGWPEYVFRLPEAVNTQITTMMLKK